jgi:hypothetical protein
MPLTLVVPGLCARPAEALANAPALRAFARNAAAPVATPDGLCAALLAALDLPPDTPVAPLAACGAGVDTGERYVVAATPVTLVAGRDDVTLAARASEIEVDEASVLVEALNRHFAPDGLAFVAPRAAAWYALLERTPALDTTPLDAAIGQPIYERLPRGDEGKTWQRWQNEIQMLLHDSAVNRARATRGLPPVNGVWFWGGGRLPPADALPPIDAHAAAGDAGDVARGVARRTGRTADRLPADLAAMLARADAALEIVVTLDPVDNDGALSDFASAQVAPAVAALERGTLDVLRIVGDGAGTAVTWRAARGRAWRRWLPRFPARPFAVPPAPR